MLIVVYKSREWHISNPEVRYTFFQLLRRTHRLYEQPYIPGKPKTKVRYLLPKNPGYEDEVTLVKLGITKKGKSLTF